MCFINIKYFGIAIFACLAIDCFSQQPTPGNPASMSLNYVRVWQAVKPDTNRNNFIFSNALQTSVITTDYFDGLGRSLQKVVKQGSYPTGGSSVDLVAPTIYDGFGRESIRYLPFAANTAAGNTSINDGIFKLNPFHQDSSFSSSQYTGETWFYSKTNYEFSPLGRPLENFATGNNWIGTSTQSSESNRHSVKIKYWLNTALDSVRIWSVTDNGSNFGTYTSSNQYAAGSLFKNVSINEEGNQIIEFKDNQQKIILRKVQISASADTGIGKGHFGWICTYYIYDFMNRLRAIIQPKGVEILAANGWNMSFSSGIVLAEQVFRFEYDAKHRLIMKKTPGAGPIHMVYDARDRLVLTQDSVMRGSAAGWKYTKYDNLNRVIETGLWLNTNTIAYHAVRADTSINYPVLTNDTTIQTKTFYDDYTWIAGVGNVVGGVIDQTNNSGNVLSASNSTWPYPQSLDQSSQVKDLVTGMYIRNSGYSSNLYDNKERIIQIQSTNILSGLDITSNQYAWNGANLITIEKHQKADLNPIQTTVIVSKFTYDGLFRVIKNEMKIASTLVNGNTMSPYHTVSELSYNSLGQISSKKLGKLKDSEGAYTNTPVETLSYDYNIRGWLLGINRPFINESSPGSGRFGLELAYDKRTSILDNFSANTYNKAQYNGNIGGLIWKSFGDGERRKYDFDYDRANRLLKADFTQRNGGWNLSAGVDYSVQLGDGVHADSAYDLNGNILAMKQNGLKLGGSETIDDLRYTYKANTNKLIEVNDNAIEYSDSKLGDFKDIMASEEEESDDYEYDPNGNLRTDKNKDITLILYDMYFNLPRHIIVDLTTAWEHYGDVYYYYDGLGKKIKKIIAEGTESTINTKVTQYVGDFVYEGAGGEEIFSVPANTLQYFMQEEGRVRFKPGIPEEGIPAAFAFDYFIKDHLGNVRMILTEDQQTDSYMEASLETDRLDVEYMFYGGLEQGRVEKDTIAGYPSDDYTDPNDFVQKLIAGENTMGTYKFLKVMAGDKFRVRASSWYKLNGAVPNSSGNDIIGAVTNSLNSLVATYVEGHGGPSWYQVWSQGSTFYYSITDFFNAHNTFDTTKPKAFVNWVLLDEHFKFVSTGSGFDQVGASNEFKIHTTSDLEVTKNGYLFIYVSNETSNVNVYFDNLQVTHIRGPLLEESHYYPFGLTMKGISAEAANFGEPRNKLKFNGGTEYSNNEFWDGEINMSIYETPFRGYDPQIGRFNQIDQLAEGTSNWSPYNFAQNNPISYNDPFGLDTVLNRAQAVAGDVYLLRKGRGNRPAEYITMGESGGWFDQKGNAVSFRSDRLTSEQIEKQRAFAGWMKGSIQLKQQELKQNWDRQLEFRTSMSQVEDAGLATMGIGMTAPILVWGAIEAAPAIGAFYDEVAWSIYEYGTTAINWTAREIGYALRWTLRRVLSPGDLAKLEKWAEKNRDIKKLYDQIKQSKEFRQFLKKLFKNDH